MPASGARRFQLEPDAPDEEPGMLMTSMIDVIFILLAFFVCVSELKKGRLEVDVPEVPSARTAPEEDARDPLVIEVTADERVFVGGEEAPDDATLERLLTRAVSERGDDVPVHVSGDREARNGTMMRVVSHLSRAGLRQIVFAVEQGG